MKKWLPGRTSKGEQPCLNLDALGQSRPATCRAWPTLPNERISETLFRHRFPLLPGASTDWPPYWDWRNGKGNATAAYEDVEPGSLPEAFRWLHGVFRMLGCWKQLYGPVGLY